MRRRVRFGLVGLVMAASMLPGIFAATPAHANYGDGPYGTCGAYSSCATVVATKSGLDVAINLADGQVIPYGTYTIHVTPLNGQGKSFQKVEFYLEDKLISTFLPDETGTATTDWDTTRDNGTHVKIIVYDQDSSSVTRTFTVAIGAAASGAQPSKAAKVL